VRQLLERLWAEGSFAGGERVGKYVLQIQSTGPKVVHHSAILGCASCWNACRCSKQWMIKSGGVTRSCLPAFRPWFSNPGNPHFHTVGIGWLPDSIALNVLKHECTNAASALAHACAHHSRQVVTSSSWSMTRK
jgi:hypothetical protein